MKKVRNTNFLSCFPFISLFFSFLVFFWRIILEAKNLVSTMFTYRCLCAPALSSFVMKTDTVFLPPFHSFFLWPEIKTDNGKRRKKRPTHSDHRVYSLIIIDPWCYFSVFASWSTSLMCFFFFSDSWKHFFFFYCERSFLLIRSFAFSLTVKYSQSFFFSSPSSSASVGSRYTITFAT